MRNYFPTKRQLFISTLVLFIVSVVLHFIAWGLALAAWESTTTIFGDIVVWIGSYIIYPSIILLKPLGSFLPKFVVLLLAALVNSMFFSSLFLSLFNYFKPNKKSGITSVSSGLERGSGR
ncbi:MAG: hypothetical protein RLN90_10275 [Balneolaceae bacterium]